MASKTLFLIKIVQKVLGFFISFWKNVFLLTERYTINIRHLYTINSLRTGTDTHFHYIVPKYLKVWRLFCVPGACVSHTCSHMVAMSWWRHRL